ncbi:MAG TPA: DUF6458 family protein [Gaiellaceae bacterium]|jgi:hypothetical protein|nr:DUF6458 family protein [Gemmatimonadota bacterium]HXV95814.1 DUF6458 family protein [Gaiellaceae bacterium]
MGYGGIGFGIFLVAVGAILRYAVTAEVAGIDIGTVGVILMVAGAVLFLLSLFFVIWARQSAAAGPPPPPPGY